MPRSNLMVVQGGGPTAVFNTSLAAIVAETQEHPEIARIYGARFGVKGLIHTDVVDLSDLKPAKLKLLQKTPGAALGTSRYRPDEGELKKLIETLRRYAIGYLLFIGGNGTMRGAETVSAFCKSEGLSIGIAGIPKTVDNDIAGTDRCPGYSSAARYIASVTRELGADLRSLPQPVTILETLGRSVGWIAAAAALARSEEGDAPHLVYVPELPFELDSFLSDLDRTVSRRGWAVAVVAEGIRKSDGGPVYETSDLSQSDPLKRPMTGGVAQHLASIVSQRLRIRCRSEKPGLLGRASMAHVSARDKEDAALVGRTGVQALISGASDVMVALNPLGECTESRARLIPLADAAGLERPIPRYFLQRGEIPVSSSFLDYLHPLVGKLQVFQRL
jgi:6-phosphofructokinase 1